MLGNFGAGGKQEHGRELRADFLWLFARAPFSLAVTVCGVFVLRDLGALGRGEGAGAPGTVPLQNPEVTSRKACLRNAETVRTHEESECCKGSFCKGGQFTKSLEATR